MHKPRSNLFYVGSVHRKIRNAQRMIGTRRIQQLVLGVFHQLVLTATGKLLLCGGGDGMGNFSKRRCNGLLDITSYVCESNDEIHAVSSKGWHTIIVTKQGRVYSFGRNRTGECGVSPRECSVIVKPLFLETLYAQDPQVQFVSTGSGHSLLASDYHVYSFGKNNNGRLGHAPSKYVCHFIAIPFFEQVFDMGRNGLRVEAVNCSCKESFVLDNRGEVYVMGDDPVPQRLVMPVPIKTIESGDFFTFFLSYDGDLYAKGGNRHGQLGLGFKCTRIVRQPTRVSSLTKVKRVACGSNHAMAITSNGKVLVWGRHNDHRLGDKKERDTVLPTRLVNRWGIKIMDAVGGTRGFALTNRPWIKRARINHDCNQQAKLGSYLHHKHHCLFDITIVTTE